MKFKNSTGLVVLLYFAIAFFPSMSIASGYLAYSEYMAGENEDLLMLSIGFAFFGFLSPFGFRILKFVRLEYTLDDQGIRISDGKHEYSYKWSTEMKVKDSGFLQLFWLYSPENRVIAMVDYMMPGFDEFSHFIKSKVKA